MRIPSTYKEFDIKEEAKTWYVWFTPKVEILGSEG